METLFYCTGMVIWIIISCIILIAVYNKIYIGSWLFHYLNHVKNVLFFDKKKPITKRGMAFLVERLKYLDENKIRKFERDFIREYIKHVPVIEDEEILNKSSWKI